MATSSAGSQAEAAGPPPSPLFRTEAVNHQLDRLNGSILIATPVSWAWITGIVAVVALVITGMSLVPYSSGPTARGMIMTDEMTLTVAASQSGTVAEVFVVERQAIQVGDRLMKIRGDSGVGIRRNRIVKATQDGVVARLQVRAGERLKRGQRLLQIVSGNGWPFAELWLSPEVVGSVALGQRIDLTLAAFPRRTFGTIEGRVVGITPRKTERPGGARPMFVYSVKVRLRTPWIIAQGRKRMLLAGMSVSAPIANTRRHLLNWFALPVEGTVR